MDGGTKSKLKKVHALHPKTKVYRQENPVMSVLMWGVDHMMNELMYVPEQPLIMPADFKAFSKVSVTNQKYNDQYLPSKFKVKEYCPIVFRDLRCKLAEDPEDYLSSLVDAPLIEQTNSGRSGATFFVTHDRRLLVKSIGRDEVEAFHHTFPAYHAYVVQNHGETLLSQYLGMYRITVNEKETYMVVMRNIFSSQATIHHIYDLKGSTVDRTASEKELERETPVLKDNDFTHAGQRIVIGEQKAAFMATLRRDSEFLASNKFMDYSLLVGIHECDKAPEEESIVVVNKHTDRYVFGEAGPGKSVYFMGIIDVLTKYTAKKMAAHTAKGMKHGPGAAISTVNPEQYVQRFIDFVESVVD
eukprot:m.143139 g.143139  ORF g.143139 m.143139 type:complete len:358 (+) comp16733_c0_seq4:171-1244(+)